MREPIDLAAIIAEVVDDCGPVAAGKGWRLSMASPDRC